MKTEFDFSYLDMVSFGDAAFRKKLLSGTMESIDQKQALLSTALQQQNAKSVRETAHSLKTLLAITGLAEMQQLMTSVEKQMAGDSFYPSCAQDIERFLVTWTEARKYLQEITETT